jgi:hypothetical protein
VHTFKGAVLASEYDFASHMNSHIYVSRFDQATWFLLHAIGMTPASMKQKNLRVAIVRQNYQFLEELRGGELVEIKSGFLARRKVFSLHPSDVQRRNRQDGGDLRQRRRAGQPGVRQERAHDRGTTRKGQTAFGDGQCPNGRGGRLVETVRVVGFQRRR